LRLLVFELLVVALLVLGCPVLWKPIGSRNNWSDTLGI
jgi:hypothetical protein